MDEFVSKKLTEKDYLFDGFCHRPYNENLDGWRNLMITNEYPVVDFAHQVIEMAQEINLLRRKVWELETKRCCQFH